MSRMPRMTVSAGETVRFYMMTAPDKLNGEVPVVKVTTADRKEMSKSLGTSYNLQAGKAYTFEVTLDAPVAPDERKNSNPCTAIRGKSWPAGRILG